MILDAVWPSADRPCLDDAPVSSNMASWKIHHFWMIFPWFSPFTAGISRSDYQRLFAMQHKREPWESPPRGLHHSATGSLADTLVPVVRRERIGRVSQPHDSKFSSWLPPIAFGIFWLRLRSHEAHIFARDPPFLLGCCLVYPRVYFLLFASYLSQPIIHPFQLPSRFSAVV